MKYDSHVHQGNTPWTTFVNGAKMFCHNQNRPVIPVGQNSHQRKSGEWKYLLQWKKSLHSRSLLFFLTGSNKTIAAIAAFTVAVIIYMFYSSVLPCSRLFYLNWKLIGQVIFHCKLETNQTEGFQDRSCGFWTQNRSLLRLQQECQGEKFPDG